MQTCLVKTGPRNQAISVLTWDFPGFYMWISCTKIRQWSVLMIFFNVSVGMTLNKQWGCRWFKIYWCLCAYLRPTILQIKPRLLVHHLKFTSNYIYQQFGLKYFINHENYTGKTVSIQGKCFVELKAHTQYAIIADDNFSLCYTILK